MMNDRFTHMRRGVRRAVQRAGWDVVRARPQWPGDFDRDEIALCEQVLPYTMTSPEAVVTLAHAVADVSARGLDGAFVECGVWKGGSMMAVAKTLQRLGRLEADLYLFDTFAGMTPPSEHDVSRMGVSAQTLLDQDQDLDTSLMWARAGVEEVRAALASTGYPVQQLHFVQGRVEQTVPDGAPERIALLRLDTDWYESTRHELEHLYPRLQSGGVLIIDDYGWWGGARKATDEYFAGRDDVPFLIRVDDSGRRMGVKPA